MSTSALIGEIVEAVRAGHDGRIGCLLRTFAVRADVAALFALRDALDEDVRLVALRASPSMARARADGNA